MTLEEKVIRAAIELQWIEPSVLNHYHQLIRDENPYIQYFEIKVKGTGWCRVTWLAELISRANLIREDV